MNSQVEMRHIEMLTATRAFDQVVERATWLLCSPWSTADAAALSFHLGQAYCRLVRPHEALEHIRPARIHFERIHDERMAVEALDWEASAMGLLEDPKALMLAQDALQRCRSLDPKPIQTEARILGHIASMHGVAREWAQAIRHYKWAAEASRQVKDLLQEAKMHHGLGIAYRYLHQPVRARQHLDKALALYAIESDPSATYRVQNDIGYLLLKEGHLDSAEEYLLKALAGSDALKIDRRGRGFILSSLGELNLRRGDLDMATKCLKLALDSGHAVGERLVLAEAHRLLGQVEELKSNGAAADYHFETALRLLEQVQMPERLRDCHIEYAKLLDARGQIVPASLHRRLAAEVAKRLQ
jgi:tetratricopeptide (TPR) repeat protein